MLTSGGYTWKVHILSECFLVFISSDNGALCDNGALSSVPSDSVDGNILYDRGDFCSEAVQEVGTRTQHCWISDSRTEGCFTHTMF